MISQSAAAVDLNVDAGTFYVDTTNNRVGVGGKTDPDTPLHVIGTVTATTFAGSGASLTSIPNSALVNSSITINSTAVSLGGSLTLTTANIAENTNLYYTNARADARIAAADTDDLSEGSSNLYYTDARVDARVSGGSLGNITTTGYIRGPATFTIDPAAHGDNTGTVVIAGNLQVDGTQTVINSTTLTVDDKNITLASGSANAAAASGAGFTVDIGSGTNPAITYDGTNDEWDFNKKLNVTGSVSATGLDVNGYTYIRKTADNNARLHIIGGRDYMFTSLSNGTLGIYDNTATSYRLTIDASGNVGIGTSQDSGKLNIYKAGGETQVKIRSDANQTGNIYFTDATSGYSGSFAYDHNDNSMRFATNGTGEKMRIDAAGNVGIGVTPKTDWHTGYDAIQIGESSAFFGKSAGDEVFMAQNARYTSSGWKYNSSGTATLFDMQSGNTRWRRAVSGSDDGTISWSDSMFIDTAGNVGIGTDTPDTNLEVNILAGGDGNGIHITSTSTTNDPALQLSRNSGAADSFRITPRGAAGSAYLAIARENSLATGISLSHDDKVGIGTTAPAHKLHVHATSGSEPLGLFQTTSAGDCAVRIEGIGGEAYLEIANTSASTGNTSNSWGIGCNDDTNLWIAYGTNGTMNKNSEVPQFYINSSTGNVGIGTANPTSNLDVNSTAYVNTDSTQAFRFTYNGSPRAMISAYGGEGELSLYRSSNAKNIYISSYYDSYFNGGNVGIGTTAPSFPLHINKGTSSYAPTDGVNENVFGINTSYNTTGTQGVTFSRLDGNWVDGISGADSAFGWLWHHENNVRGGLVYDHRGTERMQLFSSYGALAFVIADAIDGNGVPNDTNMVERLTILPGGNVGIGTTAPDKLLEVSGTGVVAKFTGTTADPPRIEFENQSGAQATIGLNPTHDFIIDTAGENVYIGADAATLGTKMLTVLSTGLVGIGTDSPDHPLEVVGAISSADSGLQKATFANVGNDLVMTANAGATNVSSNIIFKSSQSGGSAAERMRITQYGALHIDTATDYTGKSWLNENTAGSPLGGSNASGNTYQKLRLWVDGDININQGRGLHFGDVTDAAPLCIREGERSAHGTDRDRLEIWGRKQLTLTSSYGTISPGDSSSSGTARSSSFYIKKTGQMGGTWVETITTPHGGDISCRIFEDWTGRWIMVGRFAADARASIQSTWSSVSSLNTSVSQSTATAFSSDWGDIYPSEVRIMGCTDVEEYMDTRTIDFVYGNKPGGVHSYTPRQWKHFFAGGTSNGMTANAGGSPRFGFTVGYAYDGKGRWYNPNMHGMGMSDGNTTNPIAAYTTPTSNAFNWHTAQDAKLLATHYRTFASQDVYQTTGFGADDSVQGFYDSYPTEYTNMGGGTTGGGVHAAFTSAVFVLIKLN